MNEMILLTDWSKKACLIRLEKEYDFIGQKGDYWRMLKERKVNSLYHERIWTDRSLVFPWIQKYKMHSTFDNLERSLIELFHWKRLFLRKHIFTEKVFVTKKKYYWEIYCTETLCSFLRMILDMELKKGDPGFELSLELDDKTVLYLEEAFKETEINKELKNKEINHLWEIVQSVLEKPEE